jgi:NTE family protein
MLYLKFIFFSFLTLLSGCTCPHKFAPSLNPEPMDSICVPEKVRVALVLGSGGVRGMAHVGVLEVLEEEGINFDLIVGCSAGSIVGALYADNPNACAIRDAVCHLRTDNLFDLNLWECRVGLSQGRSLHRMLKRTLHSPCFEDLKIPLVVVATDLHTGELVPLASGNIHKAVQASCSIPFIFVPVDHNGRVLVDGGIINPVPINVARDLGAEVVIAVDLGELLPPTFPTNLFGVVKRSTEIQYLWQSYFCTCEADVRIQPRMCEVGTFNDKCKMQLYEAGKAAARQAMPRIRAALAKVSNHNPAYCKRHFVQLKCYRPCFDPLDDNNDVAVARGEDE